MAQAGSENPNYRVLARKYRPSDFSDLIGQDAMVRTLSNAFESGRIAQAYMLTGVRGVGKTTTARILARALNFELDGDSDAGPQIDLSTEGVHCPMILEGRHPDVIEMDAASHTGIDNIRDLIEATQYAPVSARYKVFIIDEVHMLSKQAFNGLLKTLEEPPSHVKFIFATTEIRKVPVTVLSRCQRFDLRRIDAELLSLHMKKIAALEDVAIEDEAAALIARAGEGSVRDSLSILDQAIALSGESAKVDAETVRDMLGLADRARIIDLFENLLSGKIGPALAELRNQYDVGADPSVVLSDLASFTHFVTRLKFVAEAAQDASVTEQERVRGAEFAEKLSVRVLGRTWQALLKGGQEVTMARDPLAAAEMVLVRIAHAADLPSPEQAIEQLKHLADTAPAPKPSAAPPAPADPTASTGPNNEVQSNGGDQSAKVSPLPATDNISQNRPTMSAALATRPDDAGDEQSSPPAPSATLAVSNTHPQASDNGQTQSVDLSGYGSIESLVKLAEANRDLQIKNALRNDVRVIDLSPPSFSFSLVEGADQRIVQQLTDKLRAWTGARWIIATSQDGGAPTLGETEKAVRTQQFADAESNPAVRAVLNAFPGAKVVDVRVKDDMAVEMEALPPAEPDETDTDI